MFNCFVVFLFILNCNIIEPSVFLSCHNKKKGFKIQAMWSNMTCSQQCQHTSNICPSVVAARDLLRRPELVMWCKPHATGSWQWGCRKCLLHWLTVTLSPGFTMQADSPMALPAAVWSSKQTTRLRCRPWRRRSALGWWCEGKGVKVMLSISLWQPTGFLSSRLAHMGQTSGECDLTKAALHTVCITVKAVNQLVLGLQYGAVPKHFWEAQSYTHNLSMRLLWVIRQEDRFKKKKNPKKNSLTHWDEKSCVTDRCLHTYMFYTCQTVNIL